MTITSKPKHPIQVGVVPYLNALPLCHYLPYPLVYEVPSRLESLMENKALDLALLPSISFLKKKNYKPYYRAGIIQSNGSVESVLLFYSNNIDKIENIKKVKYTSESRTSIALFKVIYTHCWGHNLTRLQEVEESYDAELIIGDRALFFEDKGYKKVDLGEIWTSWTGFPFIYALWVSQNNMDPKIIKTFVSAKEKGLENIDKIIQSTHDLPEARLRHYLTKSIQYEMAPNSLEGLALFQDYCFRLGLLKEKKDL